jgi:hypothetical protein
VTLTPTPSPSRSRRDQTSATDRSLPAVEIVDDDLRDAWMLTRMDHLATDHRPRRTRRDQRDQRDQYGRAEERPQRVSMASATDDDSPSSAAHAVIVPRTVQR